MKSLKIAGECHRGQMSAIQQSREEPTKDDLLEQRPTENNFENIKEETWNLLNSQSIDENESKTAFQKNGSQRKSKWSKEELEMLKSLYSRLGSNWT